MSKSNKYIGKYGEDTRKTDQYGNPLPPKLFPILSEFIICLFIAEIIFYFIEPYIILFFNR